MGQFSRAELEDAFKTYAATVKKATDTGNWREWAEMFTEDATYIEHAYGEFHGRAAIAEWISKVMAPYPTMYFPQEWVAYDEPNDAIVMCVQNVLPHPTDAEKVFSFPNSRWTNTIPTFDEYSSIWVNVISP